MRSDRGRRAATALLLAALLASSCAYYNTFYLARKNYDKATQGAPYLLDKPQPMQAQFFTKAIDYSKKVIASYPKSKWVDDAYVMWAKSLLAQNDPLQTVNMLQDFDTRFPKSPVRHEARFYLGVGYRQARRYNEALAAFDDFLKAAPHHDLVPYAYLERSRCLMALDRPADAAEAAGQVLERFPKSRLAAEARRQRADAYFGQGDFARARADYRYLGQVATSDDDRLDWLMHEADCLEGARDFEGSLSLLRGALSHETEPIVPTGPTTVSTPGGGVIASPGATFTPVGGGASGAGGGPGDRYGRILLRIGTANLLAGRMDPALQAYRDVLRDYPRTALGAEAQYRIGYAYETVGDDFERARTEYGHVKEQGSGGGYVDQAAQRLAMLDRLAQFRTAGGDTLQKRAEAGFVRAELYLFQLDKPERALQEYRQVATEFKGTPYEAKAMLAEAWVLGRKLSRQTTADSLLWLVARDHPATEAQLAARDYLEERGAKVPQEWIKLPERPVAPVDTAALTPPPAGDVPLGGPHASGADSARAAGTAWQQAMFQTGRLGGPRGPADSLGRGPGRLPFPADSAELARMRLRFPIDSLRPGGRPAPGLPAPLTPPIPSHGPSPDSTFVGPPSPARPSSSDSGFVGPPVPPILVERGIARRPPAPRADSTRTRAAAPRAPAPVPPADSAAASRRTAPAPLRPAPADTSGNGP